ncbi:hypothetical protein C9374_010458 [Naegleria lovaniensis]|uniref:Uncharacterized protein n=1 Tax=Naegleria lovaniensis TaxID=51637 RepID=A0AA88GHK6_NAELO|nr:uncharacterized protein C9374_010458 [Naegleria lovaniensis]KAG2374714.1 hypothetical protein C9374_010458 [Naegleria lovaniensis]
MILSDDVVPSINNNNTEATTTNSHNIQSDYAISDEDKSLTIEEFLLKKVKLNNEELMRRMNQMIEKIQSVGAKNIRDIEQTFQALKLNK